MHQSYWQAIANVAREIKEAKAAVYPNDAVHVLNRAACSEILSCAFNVSREEVLRDLNFAALGLRRLHRVGNVKGDVR